MPEFCKKPTIITAEQLTAESAVQLAEWCGGQHISSPLEVRVPTLEGTMVAQEGDWIIRGVRGEFYPCRGDIFDETYVPATDEDEDLVESLIAMSEIIDRGRGIVNVLMLSGAMFSEAATEIQRLRQQLKECT
jgi:hypothetical protein